jgi:large subunit ribosomal protein L6
VTSPCARTATPSSSSARTTPARTAPSTASSAPSCPTWSNEFTKELEIIGVGYRVLNSSPSSLELALGYSHTINYKAPEGVSFEVPAPTQILVRGIDKQQVGQVAAEIRDFRKPEPYKGKGVRYKGEYVIRKAGKAGK